MISSRKNRHRGSAQGLEVGLTRSLRVELLEDRRLLSATRAAEAINEFAYDVYEHMQNEEGNLFFSPLSVATALTMAYGGAAGQTASEMANVLHLPTDSFVHSSFNDLLTIFDTQTNTIDNFDLIVANAIWPALSLPVKANFLTLAAAYYDGTVQNLDYSNPSAAEAIINEWIEQKTNGKIEHMVDDLSPLTAMVLTNTVYFKGLWEQPFDPELTGNGAFEVSPGEYVSTPMMHTQAIVRQKTIGGFRILEMPFAGDAASMVFVMPTSWSAPNLSGTVIEAIDAWLHTPEPGPDDDWFQDDIYLPKFEITVSTGLNDLLRGLGMPAAFSSSADFSEMTPTGGVFIDNVFHKATLAVTEQGTEAAAATEVQFVLCFAAGTPVMTPDGEKRIEDLRAGDYVLARDEHNLEGHVEPRMVERTLHGEANIVELQVGGQIIRTTAPHPFFVRGRGWTPAGEIKVEDRLSTNHGDWIEVEKVLHTEKSESVYNLRVAGHRTYFVGSRDWKFGVWVHNNYYTFEADRPFHFIIRDNATSAITFMGRINDPTQSENEVKPTVPAVAPATGDFDGDGDVDGRDFLAWQRGYGMTEAQRANGDSNADGDVDAGDLSTWQETYGQTSEPVSAVVAGSETADNGTGPNFVSFFLVGDTVAAPLESDILLEMDAGDPVVLDRAFDHWLPPRRAVQDFGDIVTRRDASDEEPAPAFETWG